MTATPREVVVRTTGSGYASEIRSRGHVLLADEPVSVGGSDCGPDPYELLLASLGACISMTLRMYAHQKGIPLEVVGVRLSHRKVHAQDCADCEHQKGYVDVIEKQIELTGDLTADQRTRLLEISDRCPVHKTITGQIEIRHSISKHRSEP